MYSINWRPLFDSMQELLMLTILSEVRSKYHARVLKILRTNGFMEEKDITKMCLLTLKQSRTLINQLLGDGFITY